MTLEDYRLECGWSKNEMARRTDLDFNTLNKAINGGSISVHTANKMSRAISKELGRTIRWQDIEGLNVNV
jgi:transcriptional regulator with XRE-family HTH domain